MTDDYTYENDDEEIEEEEEEKIPEEDIPNLSSSSVDFGFNVSMKGVIAKIVEASTASALKAVATGLDPDGRSKLTNRINSLVQNKVTDAIDKAIEQEFQKFSEDHIDQVIKNMIFTPTNQWGEPKSSPMTICEIIEKKVIDYLQEKVDHNGERIRDSYGRATQSRIVFVVEKQLQSSIDSAIKNMMKEANNQLSNSLAETIKASLNSILSKIKVSTSING